MLHLSKFDRLILELGLTTEELFQTLNRWIEVFNQELEVYRPSWWTGELTVSVFDGSVSFGSALYGYGFTLPQIARLFSNATGTNYERALMNMWGERFYNPTSRQFQDSNVSPIGKPERFCNRVFLWPICRMHQLLSYKVPLTTPMDDQTKKLLAACGVPMTDELWMSFPKWQDRLRYVMSSWLPIQDAIVAQLLEHVPAQPAE